MPELEVAAPTLLQLSGSPRQMGRAHGIAARDAGALESMVFFGSFLDQIFEFQVRSTWDAWLRSSTLSLLRATVEQKLIQQIPSYYRELLSGFAEGSELTERLVLRAYVMPDVFSYVLGRRAFLSKNIPVAQGTLGCTSFVTLGDDKNRTPLLHARNLDFPSGTRWTKDPAIIEYVPEDGQRYASITSLGVPTAGVTAMNESGLTLSLNMNYSKRVTSDATPVLVVGQEVMRRAHNLKEAAAILSHFRLGAGWSFMISSYRERNAVVAESDGTTTHLRGPSDGRLVSANHFLSEELRGAEYWVSFEKLADSKARYQRVQDLVNGKRFNLSVEDAIRVLRDHEDPRIQRDCAFGSSIAQVHTVSCAVFEPEENRVYFANGLELVPDGEFRAYDLFPGPFQRGPIIARRSWDPASEARSHYCRAHEAYFPGSDWVRCLDELAKARKIQPQEPLYAFISALVQMKRGRIREAYETLVEAIKLGDSPDRLSLMRLVLARTHDLLGERAGALEIYRSLSEKTPYAKAAQRGLRHRYGKCDASRLVLDFTVGSAIEEGWYSESA